MSPILSPPEGGGLTPRVRGNVSPVLSQQLDGAKSKLSPLLEQVRGDQLIPGSSTGVASTSRLQRAKLVLPPPVATASQFRAQLLDAAAARIARAEALKDAKRALTAHDPLERAELRQNAAVFTGIATRLLAQAVTR